jgi:beta-glucosidase-like glycosyl hydrolase
VDKVHSIIRKFVASGEIKPELIDESFQRILQLKARTGNKDVASYKAEIAKLQNQIKLQTEASAKLSETKEEPAVGTTSKKKKRSKKN